MALPRLDGVDDRKRHFFAVTASTLSTTRLPSSTSVVSTRTVPVRARLWRPSGAGANTGGPAGAGVLALSPQRKAWAWAWSPPRPLHQANSSSSTNRREAAAATSGSWNPVATVDRAGELRVVLGLFHRCTRRTHRGARGPSSMSQGPSYPALRSQGTARRSFPRGETRPGRRWRCRRRGCPAEAASAW